MDGHPTLEKTNIFYSNDVLLITETSKFQRLFFIYSCTETSHYFHGESSSQPNEETLEEKTGVTPVSFAVSVLNIEKKLSDALNQLPLSPPVEYSYNPLNYAWDTHSCLVTKYCNSRKRILFVGMNPGPWGMVQTGVFSFFYLFLNVQSHFLTILKVPFGDVRLVQDWLGIIGNIGRPEKEHPKRRVQGFECSRSEVSGQRLWGFFRDLCITPDNFFKNCFVYSYCPLSFMHSTSRNITPPELKVSSMNS